MSPSAPSGCYVPPENPLQRQYEAAFWCKDKTTALIKRALSSFDSNEANVEVHDSLSLYERRDENEYRASYHIEATVPDVLPENWRKQAEAVGRTLIAMGEAIMREAVAPPVSKKPSLVAVE